jgi:hypothetical protein
MLTALGCGGSSQLVNMWRDPMYQDPPIEKPLVVALKNDPVLRRSWEDAMEAELNDRGVAAACSYRLFPESLPDTADVVEAVRTGGYDGVIVISQRDTRYDTHYVPGYVTTEPVTRYGYWRGYHTVYREVHHPGYVETASVVRHHVDVWAARDGGKLIWAATGESIDPTSSQSINREISALIVPELVEQGIIPG